MKELITSAGMALLACLLFLRIAGPGESLLAAQRASYEREARFVREVCAGQAREAGWRSAGGAAARTGGAR